MTYLITKKTNDDLFLLLASPEMNQILLYALILKALRYGFLIHGFCFLSNHFHLVVTDLRGELPAFMSEFLADTSKAIQVHLGQNRRIWSGQRYSAVELLDLDAAERKVAYSHLNPTRAGLTKPGDWPGLTSARWSFGDTLTAERPDFYFSPRYRPDEVSMTLAPLPPAFLQLNEKDEIRARHESAARIQGLVDAGVKEARKALRKRNESLPGPKRLVKVSREQRGSHPVRHLSPLFATTDRALLADAIAQRRTFDDKHHRALRRYVAGKHRVVFPPGTYGYRKLLGVRVAKDGTAA